MERYAWVLFFGLIGGVCLIGFVYFFIKDTSTKKHQQRNYRFLIPDIFLFLLSMINVVFVIYLYFDIQKQLIFFK
ncbi:hypothetical protein IGI49_001157 [Enterococcus sp. AZ071]